MLLFENAWPSNYEQIKTWYPVWYRDVLEMDALWRVWGKHLDDIQAGIVRAVNCNFIDYADAQTVTRLETFLGIVYDSPRTLVERRNVIKAFVIGSGRIGKQEIIEIISVFTAGEITVTFSGGIVYISVKRDYGDMFSMRDINRILHNRLPAHLMMDITDIAYPIHAAMRNRFLLHNLALAFAIKNRTARITGILLDGSNLLDGTWPLNSSLSGVPFVLFTAHMRTPNRSLAGHGLMLNGRYALDGSHILDATRVLTLGGMVAQRICISGNRIKNRFSTKVKEEI